MTGTGLRAALRAAFPAVLLWLAAGSGNESAAGDAEPPDPVRSAVERLGAADRADRVAAERELLDRGPPVLPLLPGPTEVVSPAVRAALDRIRTRLQVLKAEESVAGSRVTASFTGPVGDLDAPGTSRLPSGTGLTLSRDQADRKISLDQVNQPFWAVIDDLSRQARLWPTSFDPSGRLSFRDRTPADDAKQAAYSGAFRTVAGPITLKPIAGEAGGRLIRVPLEIRAEPKVRPLFLFCAAQDFELKDAAGRTLPSFTPGAQYELPFGGPGRPVELRLDFLTSDEPAAEPLSLTGEFRLVVAAGEEPFQGYFEPTDTARGPVSVKHTQTRGGVSVRFREATLNADGAAEVEIVVDYGDGGPRFDSYRTWVYHNAADLHYDLEADGRQTRVRVDHEPGFATLAEGDRGVALRYRFVGIPPAAKRLTFTYVAPTKIVELPIKVAIDGLTQVKP